MINKQSGNLSGALRPLESVMERPITALAAIVTSAVPVSSPQAVGTTAPLLTSTYFYFRRGSLRSFFSRENTPHLWFTRQMTIPTGGLRALKQRRTSKWALSWTYFQRVSGGTSEDKIWHGAVRQSCCTEPPPLKSAPPPQPPVKTVTFDIRIIIQQQQKTLVLLGFWRSTQSK